MLRGELDGLGHFRRPEEGGGRVGSSSGRRVGIRKALVENTGVGSVKFAERQGHGIKLSRAVEGKHGFQA